MVKKIYLNSWDELPAHLKRKMDSDIKAGKVDKRKIHGMFDKGKTVEYKKKPAVRWLDNWKEAPGRVVESIKQDKQKPHEVYALYDVNVNTIYAIRGKANKQMIIHEKKHAMQSKGRSENPRVHVEEEIKANMEAYKRTGKPSHIFMNLMFIYNGLWKMYRVKHLTSLILIKNALIKYKAPDAWMDDYKLLRQRAKGNY